jgi:hypothetical protein
MADSSKPQGRSVKIDQDERGGWSSDRPRPGGEKRRASVATNGRALAPAAQLVYRPGSLLVVVSGSATARDALVDRVIEEKDAVLSLGKVSRLLAQKLDADAVAAKAPVLLDAAVAKRLEAGSTVVVPLEGVDAEERERFVRMAAPHRRPCHLILVEAAPDEMAEEAAAPLAKLRQLIDQGTLGSEGFVTFIRLGGSAIDELKRVLFRAKPADD